MGKRFNPNLAKIHRSYTVGEIALLYVVHKNTVLNWIKSGLSVIDNKRPMLVLGAELKRFIQHKRQKNRRPCKPWEMYCVRCKAPRIPAGGLVDYEPINSTNGSLTGICPSCDCLIKKYASQATVGELVGKLNVTDMTTQKRL